MGLLDAAGDSALDPVLWVMLVLAVAVLWARRRERAERDEEER